MATQGGPAKAVSVQTSGIVQGGPAIPIEIVTDGRAVEGGPAQPIVIVTSGELQGGPALPVVVATGRAVLGGPAIPVYIAGTGGGGVGSAPANTVLPVISGTRAPGQTLTTTDGTWTNTPTSYSYQWYRDGVAITGATANIYVLTANDVGTTITVVVTASNAGGSASATSAGVGVADGFDYYRRSEPLLITLTGAANGFDYYRRGEPLQGLQ